MFTGKWYMATNKCVNSYILFLFRFLFYLIAFYCLFYLIFFYFSLLIHDMNLTNPDLIYA